MNKLRLIYFGSSTLSAELLKNILEIFTDVNISAVITNEDILFGRKRILKENPVKSIAKNYSIPVFHDFEVLEQKIFDLAIVFAYGKIIPSSYLKIPTFGFWNIHPSLLPEYRGPSPTTFPILLGENLTGISLMKMDEFMDHGEVVEQIECKISDDDTRTILEHRALQISIIMLQRNIRKLSKNKPIVFQEQNHSLATYTQKLTRDDGFIDKYIILKGLKSELLSSKELPSVIKKYYERNPTDIRTINTYEAAKIVYNCYRGLNPWPGIWTIIQIHGQKKRLKLLDIAMKGNKITINSIQIEGKKPTDFLTFSKAYPYILS